MRSRLTLIVVAAAALAVVGFMVTYSVRFTETAVVATFGKADAGDVVKTPGLRFRIPLIQQVTKYDTRARLVRATLETLQTADNRQIVAQAFATWRVADPLKFYQKFSGAGVEAEDHYRQAEETIRAILRSAMAAASRFTLDELLQPGDNSAVAQLEESMFAQLKSVGEGGANLASFGVEPLLVGVSEITLPEDTTESVFERMKASRERLAAEAESQGASQAAAIRAEAESAASRIRAFARRRAEEIRNQGDVEAQQWIAKLAQEPELAVFLDQLDLLRTFYARRATLIVPVTAPGMSVFDPNLLTRLNDKGLAPFVADAGRSGRSPYANDRAQPASPQHSEAAAEEGAGR
ncbi:MAG: hypothetical protein D6824_01025 [Planctomycetota bacterium]|nr:MAG: hypothetical protein D6824_01025 [Planctomycetota bacterium]